MAEISRRRLFKLGAGATAAIGASQVLSGCGEDEGGSSQQAASTATSQPQAKKATVHVIKGTDLYAMTREALTAVGGIGAFVKAGETVFIKPNFVTMGAAATKNVFTNGECTKVEIITTVAEECLKAGASEVIIGDGAQAMTFDWKLAKTLDGSKNLFAEAERLRTQYAGKKVTLVCLAGQSPEWIDIPSKTGFGKLKLSSYVAKADKVISIPVLKTHQYCVMTLALKNFVGTLSLEEYNTATPSTRSDLHLTTGGIEQSFLDVVAAVKPVLALIDCSIGCEGNGPGVAPTAGITVDVKTRGGSWMILASSDLLAADATAARMTSHNPENIRFVGLAKDMGLGVMDADLIEIKGAKLEDIKMEWKQAQLKNPEALLTPKPATPTPAP